MSSSLKLLPCQLQALKPARPSGARPQRPRVQQRGVGSSFARRSGAVLALASSSSTSTTSASTSASTSVDYFASDSRPIILFDGVCNLCNGGVNFMLQWDAQGAYRMAALQSAAGMRLLQRCGRRPDDISSIVLVEKDKHFTKSEAILRIGSRLGVPLPALAALGFPVPLPIRDTVYDLVANNRYNVFGYAPSCRLSEEGFKDRFIE